MKQSVSYDRLHPPHPQPSNLYTIGQPYLNEIMASNYKWLCVMQISWLASFLLFKNKVTLQLLGDAAPRPPASEIYYWNKFLLSQMSESAWQLQLLCKPLSKLFRIAPELCHQNVASYILKHLCMRYGGCGTGTSLENQVIKLV